MPTIRAALMRIAGLFGRTRRDRDLEAEIDSHLQLHIDDNLRAGMTPVEARRHALLKLGGADQTKEAYRDRRGFPLMDSLLQDVRYACRGMRRAPLFAASVAVTIGLGLGVFTSAFTILNAYFLRPVDLPNPHQLYALSWDTATEPQHRFALADFEALRDGAPFFSGLVAAEEGGAVMQDGAPAGGLLVSGNYFQVLGARAAMGRLLTPNDAAVPDGGAVVVLSHMAWRSHYGADPAIIGKEIMLGRQRVTVVGVTEPGYGLSGEELVTFWVPLTMARAFGATVNNPDGPSVFVIGRLREGSSSRQVRAWLDTWLRQRFPAGSDSAPLAVHVESRATHIPLTGPEELTLMFALLTAAFGLVLLIACANVTSLMLARAFGRQQEIAIRLSLGASRSRIARQLLIESLTLALPASAVGLALTVVTTRVFPALIVGTFPDGFGPVEAAILPLNPDVRVMAALFVAAVTAAAVVSVAPAMRLIRVNLLGTSKGDGAWGGQGSRLRTGLVGFQIGACVLFLVTAMGLIDVATRTVRTQTGLSYEHVTEVTLTRRIRPRVAARLQSDPAVERVAAAWRAPLSGPMPTIDVVASRTRIERPAGFQVVSPEYFPLFGIPIVRGRAFTALEADENAAVALVSEATAHVLWPGLDPIDQTLDLVTGGAPVSTRRPAYTSVRVIGVTGDVVSGMPADGVDTTCVYFATSLRASDAWMMLVRGGADMAAVTASVTAAVNAIDPNAPFQYLPMRTFIGGLAWIFQAFFAAASCLGVVGLILAFSGTYAVVAFLVMQRTREFGIRIALGATAGQIVSGVLRETLATASLGIGAGLVMAAGLAQVFRGPLQIIPKFSVVPYLVGTAVVVMATAAAALIPSLRITRIDPSRALRVE